ncbi:MAG: hypothetical protein RIS94_2511 [Pseudomonadota bacterium]|jgi:MFS family permease
MPGNASPADRLPVWPLFLIFMIVFINFAGFSIVIPLLPFYGKLLHATPVEVTMLFAAYSLGGVFGEIYWGRLSDRHGRRAILIGTTACAALSYVAFAYATALLPALVIRVCSGFFSGTMGVCAGYIADVTRPDQRARSMGKLGAAINMGFAIGPALGGMLARPEMGLPGFRLPILVAATVAGLAALWSLFVLKETNPGGRERPAPHWAEAFRQVAGDGLLGRLFAITFIGIGTFASMEAVFGLWTSLNFGWTTHEVGLTFIAVGAAGFMVQMVLIGPATARWGEGPVIVAGLCVLALSMALQPVLRAPIASVVLMATLMCGHSIAFPTAGGLISRVTPPAMQGSIGGLLMASNALSRIVAPPLLGLSFQSVGPDSPYYLCAAIVGVGVLLGVQVVGLRTAATAGKEARA